MGLLLIYTDEIQEIIENILEKTNKYKEELNIYLSSIKEVKDIFLPTDLCDKLCKFLESNRSFENNNKFKEFYNLMFNSNNEYITESNNINIKPFNNSHRDLIELIKDIKDNIDKLILKLK